MQNLLAVISLGVIRRNAELIARAAKKPLIAVVKDDAYGHGAEAVALALRGRTSAFAVSTVDEGAALRTAGVGEDILVLTPPLDGDDALRIISYGLTAAGTSLPVLRLLAGAGERLGIAPRVHLKINTGMNRYGVEAQRAESFAMAAKRLELAVEGVYSHLYAAEDREVFAEQTRLFKRAAEEVRAVFPACVRHLSATGGSLAGDEFDLVRTGIALYGYLPAGFEGKLSVTPAMKLYATVSNICRQTGGGVGYAIAQKYYGDLYTLRIGYGDGLFRTGFDGAIGKLCMDASVCAGRARFAEQRRVLADMEAYARQHGTSVYEVLVNVAGKAVRRYE